jgi:hypothetical protein
MTCRFSSSCIASRSDTRDTRSTSANSRSGGSLVPGVSEPLLMSVSMCATISSLTLTDRRAKASSPLIPPLLLV